MSVREPCEENWNALRVSSGPKGITKCLWGEHMPAWRCLLTEGCSSPAALPALTLRQVSCWVLGTQQSSLSGSSWESWVLSVLPPRWLWDLRHSGLLICKIC